MTRTELEQALEREGLADGRQFARFWYQETLKIAEQVDDPATRWEIMQRALKLLGWVDAPAR